MKNSAQPNPMTGKLRTGPRPLAPGLRRDVFVMINLRPAERERIVAAAYDRHQSASEFCREAALEACPQPETEAQAAEAAMLASVSTATGAEKGGV